jgi:hypothetical protein
VYVFVLLHLQISNNFLEYFLANVSHISFTKHQLPVLLSQSQTIIPPKEAWLSEYIDLITPTEGPNDPTTSVRKIDLNATRQALVVLRLVMVECAFDTCKAGWKTKANAGARSTNSHVVVTRKNDRFTILHKFIVPTHIPILNYVDGVNFQTYLVRSKINKNKNGFCS